VLPISDIDIIIANYDFIDHTNIKAVSKQFKLLARAKPNKSAPDPDRVCVGELGFSKLI
jgi:hypothetical protein